MALRQNQHSSKKTTSTLATPSKTAVATSKVGITQVEEADIKRRKILAMGCVATVAVAIVILSLTLINILLRKDRLTNDTLEMCTTPSCLKLREYLTSFFKSGTNPCTDYYDHVCGKFDETSTLTVWEKQTQEAKENVLKTIQSLNESTADHITEWFAHRFYTDCVKTLNDSKHSLDFQQFIRDHKLTFTANVDFNLTKLLLKRSFHNFADYQFIRITFKNGYLTLYEDAHYFINLYDADFKNILREVDPNGHETEIDYALQALKPLFTKMNLTTPVNLASTVLLSPSKNMTQFHRTLLDLVGQVLKTPDSPMFMITHGLLHFFEAVLDEKSADHKSLNYVIMVIVWVKAGYAVLAAKSPSACALMVLSLLGSSIVDMHFEKRKVERAAGNTTEKFITNALSFLSKTEAADLFEDLEKLQQYKIETKPTSCYHITSQVDHEYYLYTNAYQGDTYMVLFSKISRTRTLINLFYECYVDPDGNFLQPALFWDKDVHLMLYTDSTFVEPLNLAVEDGVHSFIIGAMLETFLYRFLIFAERAARPKRNFNQSKMAIELIQRYIEKQPGDILGSLDLNQDLTRWKMFFVGHCAAYCAGKSGVKRDLYKAVCNTPFLGNTVFREQYGCKA